MSEYFIGNPRKAEAQNLADNDGLSSLISDVQSSESQWREVTGFVPGKE